MGRPFFQNFLSDLQFYIPNLSLSLHEILDALMIGIVTTEHISERKVTYTLCKIKCLAVVKYQKTTEKDHFKKHLCDVRTIQTNSLLNI